MTSMTVTLDTEPKGTTRFVAQCSDCDYRSSGAGPHTNEVREFAIGECMEHVKTKHSGDTADVHVTVAEQ